MYMAEIIYQCHNKLKLLFPCYSVNLPAGFSYNINYGTKNNITYILLWQC